MKKIILPIIIALTLVGCDQKKSSKSYSESSIDSIAISSTLQQTDKKFIHEANVDGEVKDVLKSTLMIEKNAVDLGGYITTSKIDSELKSEKIEPISKDSAKEIKIYKKVAQIQVKVPQIYLSQFLASVNKEIEYLNLRDIEATDVTYQGKELSLDEKRLQQTNNKLDTVKIPAKNKTSLIEKQDLIQQSKDQTELAKAILSDRIKFSTVSIYLKGKDSVKETIIPNTDHYELYTTTHLGYRLKTAFISGWNILQTVIVSLCYLWPFALLVFIGFIIYKKYNKQNKNNK